MKYCAVLLCIALYLFAGRLFAQEELIGKSKAEAIRYLDSLKLSYTVSSNKQGYILYYIVDSVLITKRQYKKWNDRAILIIGISRSGSIVGVVLHFDKINKRTRKRPKQALRELTEKFGEPRWWWYEGPDMNEYTWKLPATTNRLSIGRKTKWTDYEVTSQLE